MKKNLRIVSAAAAALLAVAPVAAAGVVAPASSVNADAIASFDSLGSLSLKKNDTVKVTPNITLSTANTNLSVQAAISGTVTASVNGQSYNANFTSDDETTLWGKDANGSNSIYPGGTVKYSEVKNLQDVKSTNAGNTYYVHVNNLGFNFGTANANKEINLDFGDNGYFTNGDSKGVNKAVVKTGANGVVNLTNVYLKVTAKDLTNVSNIYFVNRELGNIVTTGDITLNANTNQQLNVDAVVAQALKKYTAYQVNINNGSQDTATITDHLKDALKQQNITVDAAGYFTAPKSFTFNLTAESNSTSASTTLPVTVTVPNGKEATAAQEVTENKTIMHISTVYDKNGKATNEPALRAYNTYSFVKDPVELKDASGKVLGKFYKLAGKDQYVKVGNIDGTKRTLKHNAYTYKSNGKRNRAYKTIKKGTELTTYGKSFMINGSQMYRVGKSNQYIKVANFR